MLPGPGHAELLRALRFPPLMQEKLMAAEGELGLSHRTLPAQTLDSLLAPSASLAPRGRPGSITQLDHTWLSSGWASPAMPAAPVPPAGAGSCRGEPGPSLGAGDTAVPSRSWQPLTDVLLTAAGSLSALI